MHKYINHMFQVGRGSACSWTNALVIKVTGKKIALRWRWKQSVPRPPSKRASPLWDRKRKAIARWSDVDVAFLYTLTAISILNGEMISSCIIDTQWWLWCSSIHKYLITAVTPEKWGSWIMEGCLWQANGETGRPEELFFHDLDFFIWPSGREPSESNWEKLIWKVIV